MFRREISLTIEKRLCEPRGFMQVVVGPRQTGKTTAIEQALKSVGLPSHVGRGQNTRERSRSALGHAELAAIDEACRARGDWRLDDCTLFVTLEPCPMCAGAIINARVGRVVFGAREARFGSCGSVVDLFSENYGFHPAVYKGILEDECQALMERFFKTMRKKYAQK